MEEKRQFIALDKYFPHKLSGTAVVWGVQDLAKFRSGWNSGRWWEGMNGGTPGKEVGGGRNGWWDLGKLEGEGRAGKWKRERMQGKKQEFKLEHYKEWNFRMYCSRYCSLVCSWSLEVLMLLSICNDN